MLGTIKHLGDGDVPQDTFALVGGLNQLQRSRFEQWMEENWQGDSQGDTAQEEDELVE